jgi:hypothetical protein
MKDLSRSNTMPNLYVNKPTPNHHTNIPNKTTADKNKMIKEDRERKQRVEYERRKNEIELIRPKEDIQLLNLKYKELENVRGGAKTNLRQNLKQHVNTLYEQEGKYLGERAQLYKTKVYNPYQLKQYVESVKTEPSVNPNLSNGSGIPSHKEVNIPDETGQHRPTLFADKTFHDYSAIKRAPLENILLNPNASADSRLQENGFIQEQTTYGGSYNTKKFLQGYFFKLLE